MKTNAHVEAYKKGLRNCRLRELSQSSGGRVDCNAGKIGVEIISGAHAYIPHTFRNESCCKTFLDF